MKVLIAGGGIGGLTLAQALHQGGMDVTVYEQDPTPTTRNQGYRIHINEDGDTALRTCLPTTTFDLVRQTSGTNDDVMGTYTHRLEKVMSQRFPNLTDDMITNVDRNTFRRALLTDLGVHFGQSVAGYQVVNGRVQLHLTNGTTDEGDLLVGADGIGSPVRRQLVPHAAVRDLGLRCRYGRIPITDAIPEVLRHGFTWVSDNTGLGAGFAPVRFRSGDEPNYLMVTLLGPENRLDRTTDWHPALQKLFARVDRFFPVPIRAGQRTDPWQPGPVTLLGDAIHAMPPAGGVGANTALQDAATLASELLAGKPIVDAVSSYERVMLPRGFATIDNSLRMVEQMFTHA